MDHIPYPVSTSVLPVEVPFLVSQSLRGTDRAFSALTNAEGGSPDGIITEADTQNDSANLPACGSCSHSTKAQLATDSRLVADWTSDFWRYPEKRGWSVAGLRSWWTSDPHETARRAQEWLYFELLDTFLGVPVDWTSLSRQDQNDHKKLLDSSILPELLTQWRERQSISEPSMQLNTGDPFTEAVKENTMQTLLARVALECNRLDKFPEPSRSTSLAIRILVETLTTAIYSLARAQATDTSAVQKLEQNPLLEERFLSNSWCPFQIARLWGQYLPSTTYYLSSLPREPTFGGVTHERCNENRCMTTTIDPSTYESRHTESCSRDPSSCHMVGVQSFEVANCIKRGRIPLIKFEECVDGILRPAITEFRSGLQYVALSHVWSGGLGNVDSNSMFSCQLRELHNLLLKLRNDADDELDRNLGQRKYRDMIRNLRKSFGVPLPEPPILLWIDTLCVPVGREHQETRQTAIAQMAQIYVEAQCVLVVDPELQKMTHKGLPDEQIFGSILCSSWNSRSWTFQEACMARVFYVQFADGHDVIDEKWHSFMKSIDPMIHSDIMHASIDKPAVDPHETLMLEVSDWFRAMPVMTKIRGYDTRTLMSRSEDWQNFVRVWNGLRTRSTTKTDDLYGIIAIMVDLSAHEILRLDPRERMKAVLRSQSSLPLPLLYQDCPKICDLEGKALWAPSEIGRGHIEMDHGYMSLENDGLLINARRSDTARHTWPGVYSFSSDEPLPTLFTLRLAHLGLSATIKLSEGSHSQATELTGSWVILAKETLRVGPRGQTVPGVLLSLRAVEESILDTTYVCPLRLSSKDLDDEDSGEKAFQDNTQSSALSLAANPVSLNDSSIRIQTDMGSWYQPKLRISKRLLSTSTILRNLSTLFEFGAIALTSALYLLAIIGCAVHQRQPLVRKILYLLVARYLTIFVDLFWVTRAIVVWDSGRTSRWSTRLYGEVKMGRLHQTARGMLHPSCVTKMIPLLIGSVSFGLYLSHSWPWAKWFGIVEFLEIGLRLTFTGLSTAGFYLALGKWWTVMSREDLGDMPEDMTNYSRTWRERNERDERRRAERRARVLNRITAPRCLGLGRVEATAAEREKTLT